jgi:hypothetical protein
LLPYLEDDALFELNIAHAEDVARLQEMLIRERREVMAEVRREMRERTRNR